MIGAMSRLKVTWPTGGELWARKGEATSKPKRIIRIRCLCQKTGRSASEKAGWMPAPCLRRAKLRPRLKHRHQVAPRIKLQRLRFTLHHQLRAATGFSQERFAGQHPFATQRVPNPQNPGVVRDRPGGLQGHFQSFAVAGEMQWH